MRTPCAAVWQAELKLIDFGFAAELTHSKKDAMNEQLGTPSYMAPELWSTTGEECVRPHSAHRSAIAWRIAQHLLRRRSLNTALLPPA